MQKDQLGAFPFVTRDDFAAKETTTFRLEVNVFSDSTSKLKITGATRAGVFSFKATPSGTTNADVFNFGLPDVPFWLTVEDLSDNYQPGTTWVSVRLEANRDSIIELCSGWVYSSHHLNFPATQYDKPHLTTGLIKVWEGTDRAANTEVTETVDDSEMWKIIAFRVRLVTDANAATRLVHLQITDGTNVLLDIPASATQTASLTRDYTFLAGLGHAGATGNLEILTGIPANLIMQDNWKIRTVTDNLQVTDNYAAPFITIERGFNPPGI